METLKIIALLIFGGFIGYCLLDWIMLPSKLDKIEERLQEIVKVLKEVVKENKRI